MKKKVKTKQEQTDITRKRTRTDELQKGQEKREQQRLQTESSEIYV